MKGVMHEWISVEGYIRIMKHILIVVQQWYIYALLEYVWEDFQAEISHEVDLKRFKTGSIFG